jgi:hypothetical protein
LLLVEGAEGGDELSSPILPIVDPADGGDELCSVAPPEVSALPDGGMVADLDASGDTVLSVGGEVSAARAGINPITSAVAAIAKRRVIVVLLSLLAMEVNASANGEFPGASR